MLLQKQIIKKKLICAYYGKNWKVQKSMENKGYYSAWEIH